MHQQIHEHMSGSGYEQRLQARLDRGMSRFMGGITVLLGLGLISKLMLWDAVGGAIVLYAGLVLLPMTRRKVTLGVLGFTKVRAWGAHSLWLFMALLGLMIAQPW